MEPTHSQPTHIHDGSTLLTYSLVTDPMPVQVSASATNSSNATLTFVASCPRSVGRATVGKIKIFIPCDDPKNPPNPTNLAAAAPTIANVSITSSGKDEWVPAPGQSAGEFSFTPKDERPVEISEQSLTIQFTDLPINTVVGTALVTIEEWAVAGAVPLTNSPPAVLRMGVAKFPYGFYAGNFTTDKPKVSRGEKPVLSWMGSANASFKILYEANDPEDVSHLRSWSPKDGLTEMTTFILQASAQESGQTALIAFCLSIEVLYPSLTINDLTVLKTSTIRGDGTGPGLTVDANANVGVKTTTPGFALQVGDQNTVGSAKLCVAGKGATGNWRQWTLRTGDGADYQNIHKLRVRDEQAAADRLVIDMEGKVGIGTTDPACKLDLFSNNSSFGILRVTNDTTVSGEASIGFFETNARDYNSAWVAGVGGWSNTSDFVIGNMNGGGGGDVRLLIEKAGNVGVGTNTPSAKLEVNGDLKVNGSIIMGDWKFDTRFDNAWGSGNSALYISWKGRDACRIGTVNDMFQVSIYDRNGNKHGYFYMNDSGDVGRIG